MAVVTLEILEPAHQASILGAAAVRLHGQVTSAGHPPLTIKWYSSLVGPPTPADTDASIRVPPDGTPLDYQRTLPLGSQIISLTAKDRPTESAADLQQVTHAGMAGGPAVPGALGPCVVHVLRATILTPANGAALARGNATIEAEAPPLWDTTDYQTVNQLQFVWRLAPTGNPPGRRSAQIVLSDAMTVFDKTTTPPRLRHGGGLPALDSGAYTLTLRVQRLSQPAIGHEQSIAVTLT
jgi:hypothetical protein